MLKVNLNTELSWSRGLGTFMFSGIWYVFKKALPLKAFLKLETRVVN